MEILRQLLLALEQAQSLTDVNIAAGLLRQELESSAPGSRATPIAATLEAQHLVEYERGVPGR